MEAEIRRIMVLGQPRKMKWFARPHLKNSKHTHAHAKQLA
jgi:hypothetical protein